MIMRHLWLNSDAACKGLINMGG